MKAAMARQQAGAQAYDSMHMNDPGQVGAGGRRYCMSLLAGAGVDVLLGFGALPSAGPSRRPALGTHVCRRCCRAVLCNASPRAHVYTQRGNVRYAATPCAGQGAVAHQVGSTHGSGHRWGPGVCQAAAACPLRVCPALLHPALALPRPKASSRLHLHLTAAAASALP